MRPYGPIRPKRRKRIRRRYSAKTHSIDDLLARQPKTLRKHADYPQLVLYLTYTPRLRSVRLSGRCFSLLHHARIDPGNLEHFFRTYRLPKHSFFPLFLRIKRDYFFERARKQEQRRRYILERMRSLPEPVVGFVRYLGYFENHCNAAGDHPLWDQYLFPSTKKQVHEYCRYTHGDWIAFFRSHLNRLERRYRSCHRTTTARLLACFVLECLPADYPPDRPPAAVVKRRFRELSLRHHPDHGGDAAMFHTLKQARETLLH